MRYHPHSNEHHGLSPLRTMHDYPLSARSPAVRGSQIYRWKRGQFAAPTAVWCTARRLGVEEVLSRRNLEGITPILRHCGARGDHRSNGGRQEAPGVTTKLLQSWDVQPFNRFNMQQVKAATNPTSLSQIAQWFPSKVMYPPITNSGHCGACRKYYKVLRLAHTIVTPILIIISERVYGLITIYRTKSHVPTTRVFRP